VRGRQHARAIGAIAIEARSPAHAVWGPSSSDRAGPDRAAAIITRLSGRLDSGRGHQVFRDARSFEEGPPRVARQASAYLTDGVLVEQPSGLDAIRLAHQVAGVYGAAAAGRPPGGGAMLADRAWQAIARRPAAPSAIVARGDTAVQRLSRALRATHCRFISIGSSGDAELALGMAQGQNGRRQSADLAKAASRARGGTPAAALRGSRSPGAGSNYSSGVGQGGPERDSWSGRVGGASIQAQHRLDRSLRNQARLISGQALADR